MKTKAIIRSLAPSIGALFLLGFSQAHAQWGVPQHPRYYYNDSYAPAGTANRVPYPIVSAPGYYYYYDPVNRSYPLTPEPIWRAMFPGIRGRLQAEVREFGTPGVTAGELAYWRALYRRSIAAEAERSDLH